MMKSRSGRLPSAATAPPGGHSLELKEAGLWILWIIRFVGRRGLVRKLYCDNATNFVGAARTLDLKATFHGNTADMEMFAAERGMEFVFIPPRAPHFGGLWEAAVKSAKGLLLKAMGSARLRQDEVATVLVEVEAVLNSRPMVAPSSNPNDGEVLTPGHFLIGATLVPLPIASTEPVDDVKLTLLKDGS
ncbi:uncharacterized protein LOC122757728 [Drosophila mojavensis]|uniref:uncharacterized protein LOC122757728 n=1 Tax=Drosophila mojavensis TaxID=7230 RepID=UPI001CD07BBF|nr:uncharacterized protein LOC122757728 [Drosophila mojavensis]